MNESIEQFTSSEINVLKLVVEGKTNKEIANDLNTSVSTVKWHVQNILNKTGFRDRKLLIVEFFSVLQKINKGGSNHMQQTSTRNLKYPMRKFKIQQS